MKGAGTLAHEWGHALDNILSKKLSDSNFDSYLTNGNGKALSSVKELMNTIKYCDVSDSYKLDKTEFYKNSELCDCYYSKESMGYWSSDKEMFARAFSCYVEDKLVERSCRSDYLCGLSDSAVFMHDGELKKAFPDGDERKAINKCFDKVFDQLKELGLLHSQELVPVKRKSR